MINFKYMSGCSTQKGMNSQNWAALSLFLQYLHDSNFDYIHLEAPGFQDFNLVFKDGRKIICESKDRKKEFSYPHLREVLRGLINRRVPIGDNDEILIICTNLNNGLKSNLKYYKYFDGATQTNKFKNKKFTTQEVNLLSKVKFWNINPVYNEKSAKILFYDLLRFYVPKDDFNHFVNSYLTEIIVKKSIKGALIKKEDVFARIEKFKKRISEKLGTETKEKMEIINNINSLSQSELVTTPEWYISDYSTRPDELNFLLKKLEKKENILQNLRLGEKLWQINTVRMFSHSVFNIFKNNTHTKQNREYILSFFNANIKDIHNPYFADYFDVQVIDLVKNILNQDTSKVLIKESFELLKKIVNKQKGGIFYLEKNTSKSYERDKIAELLNKIYVSGGNKCKKKLYEFVIENFNLIEDSSGRHHSRYTPSIIFDTVLKEWLIANKFKHFEKRFIDISKELSLQFDGFYKNKLSHQKGFAGWELFGGVSVSWGHDYHITDRLFVTNLLSPAIKDYYKRHPRKAWSFINGNCISRTKKGITKNHPDFLNRVALPVILERYKTGGTKSRVEAFRILKDFIIMKRGLPTKYEIIYQYIRDNSKKLENKRIWALIDVFLNEYKTTNIFIDQIITDLVSAGDKKAQKMLLRLYDDPDYFKNVTPSNDFLRPVRLYLNKNYPLSVKIFLKYISSSFFQKHDPFNAFEAADLMSDILKKDSKSGYAIIKKLILSQKINQSSNIQTVIYSGLLKYGEKLNEATKINKIQIEKLYNFLRKYIFNNFQISNKENNAKLVKNIPSSQSRSSIVQLAEVFAKAKMIEQAITIIKVFIHDPSPYLPGQDPEDPNDEYNEHSRLEKGKDVDSIATVRGWCAWILMKCAVLEGRTSVDDIIKLTRILVSDKNLYVKHMACSILSQLMQVRFTHLPSDKNKLFFDDNSEKALKKSKSIESLVWKLLQDVSSSNENIRKSMGKNIVHMVAYLRTLNTEDALKLLKTIQKFPDNIIAEASPLFIYYAEFRKKAFKKWKWKTTSLYSDLRDKDFDNRQIKRLLEDIIKTISDDHNSSFVHQFKEILKQANIKTPRGRKEFDVAYQYLNNKNLFLNKYQHHTYELVFMIIEGELEKNRKIKEWYPLAKNYLQKEKAFFQKNITPENVQEMYWWPSHCTNNVINMTYEKMGKQKFLELLKIKSLYPPELSVDVGEENIELLKKIPESNFERNKIIKTLKKTNPAKYYDLK